MEYLIKVNTIIIIFYLFYKLLLQKDTFFQQNRFFLLIGLLVAVNIPFIVIPVYVEHNPISIYNFNKLTNTPFTNIETRIELLDYVTVIYFLGVIFFFIKFLIQAISLIFMIIRNKKMKHHKYTYVETKKNISPFSFFKWIVYNPEKLNKIELEHIIKHEKVHANHYHSVDVLLINLACILIWFNPFIWFYSKLLKQNLEFIADYKATHNTNSKKSYQYILLKNSLSDSQKFLITTNFYNSLIKKRIIMLQKTKTRKINQVKYVLIIPTIVLFLISCNSETTIISNEDLAPFVTVSKNNNEYPLIIVDGEEISMTELKKINANDVKMFSVLKDKTATDKYGEKGKNGVIIVTMEDTKNLTETKIKDNIKITGYAKTSN